MGDCFSHVFSGMKEDSCEMACWMLSWMCLFHRMPSRKAWKC